MTAKASGLSNDQTAAPNSYCVYQYLVDEQNVTHLALRLLILNGSRSLPVRALKLNQIEGDVWTIPAQLMKGTKGKTLDFRIPLSQEALNVVDLARPFSRNGWLFAAPRVGMISDATMSRLMERRGLSRRLQDIGNHGFALSQ